jgi:hypothetical protein
MHQRPNWETERVALVPTTKTARGGRIMRVSGRVRVGNRRDNWRKKVEGEAQSQSGEDFNGNLWAEGRMFSFGRTLQAEAQFYGDWLEIRRSGGPLNEPSWDQDETGQFKADRLRKWTTHHSNFFLFLLFSSNLLALALYYQLTWQMQRQGWR